VPWKIRRQIILIIFGAIALAMSAAVIGLNSGAAFDLLAGVGVLGALAIVLNTTPENGDHDS